MVKGIAIIAAVIVVSFYFLFRPAFINGTVLENGTAIQTHFGFCYHPLGMPIPFRTTLVKIPKNVEPIQNADTRGTNWTSCKDRYGIVFGLLLPLRETIVVEVRYQ
ncbi:hypothetical protein HY969_03200 [Candidatus Kaiserbacteria bacterium]|nr:hypothetical protein [Candidatus Kaiserbacteria bacterium]